MANIIQQLKEKDLVSEQKVSLEEFLDLDLSDSDDFLIYVTEWLSSHLNELMVAQKLTRSDLADKMGISKQAVSNMMSQNKVSITWLLKAIMSLGGVVDMNLLLPKAPETKRENVIEKYSLFSRSSKLAYLRKKLKFSVVKLAKKAHVKEVEITNIEKLDIKPPKSVAERLAKVMNVSPQFFL